MVTQHGSQIFTLCVTRLQSASVSKWFSYLLISEITLLKISLVEGGDVSECIDNPVCPHELVSGIVEVANRK